jgi:hypothetical protein
MGKSLIETDESTTGSVRESSVVIDGEQVVIVGCAQSGSIYRMLSGVQTEINSHIYSCIFEQAGLTFMELISAIPDHSGYLVYSLSRSYIARQ